MQAAADARGAADAQEAWLKQNMSAHFSRKLLGVVKRIEQHMGPRDSDPDHQFPRLAGSYLSEVCSKKLCVSCPAISGSKWTSAASHAGLHFCTYVVCIPPRLVM